MSYERTDINPERRAQEAIEMLPIEKSNGKSPQLHYNGIFKEQNRTATIGINKFNYLPGACIESNFPGTTNGKS